MTRNHPPRIAIVGATGAVGREMFRILKTRDFAFSDIVPFASERSLGKKIELLGREYVCRVLKPGCFNGVDFAFFDAADEISREWVPEALRSDAIVIDNSATYRMSEAPLIVPEVNGDLAFGQKLIAGPNCTTVQLTMALKPLHDRFGLKRVIVSTYQSVSGAGTAAMTELTDQLGAHLAGQPYQAKALKHPIAMNCIPQIGKFDADGFTSEETKVVAETRKILGIPDLAVSCTAVRVPTLSAHSESVNAEFERPVSVTEAREVLAAFPGVVVVDEPSDSLYPMNISSSGRDEVFVGRIRKDPSHPNGLQFWVVSDNLRKGAALNAIQVAEKIIAGR